MVEGEKWYGIALDNAKKSKSYRKFFNGMGKRKSVICAYAYGLNKFMLFLQSDGIVKSEKDFDKLTDLESKQITDILQEYVFSLNLIVKGVSVRHYLNSPELFFTMNDLIWNIRLVKKSIHRDDSVPGGRLPATDEDVKKLIFASTNHFEKSLLHFLFSTGIRPGAVADPVLRIKHLYKMPHNCYAIKVYDESKEGYWAFLTPEASKALDDYFSTRKINGEKLDVESIIFKPVKTGNVKRKKNYITASIARTIVYKLIKNAGIKRIKTGNRYDKTVIYMFRKRFNGILKLDNQINSNIAEKLMAHNSKKIELDTNYLEPTKEQCFTEFYKATTQLTVDPTERQNIQLLKKQEKIVKLEEQEKKLYIKMKR